MKAIILTVICVVLFGAQLYGDTQAGFPDKIVGTWVGEGTDGSKITLKFDAGDKVTIKVAADDPADSINLTLTVDMQFANDDLQAYEANLVSGDVVFMKATFMFVMGELNVKFDNDEDYTPFKKK